ncbi:MAG TPA: metallophosphoesterase [Clostridia bacterium]|nr:metallophosphoesterase [Clostridia bacterium]
MYKGKLRFNENKKFIILQVSDAQDMHFVRKTMIKMLNKAYDTIRPDLVVLTGDNILGNHLQDASLGYRKVSISDKETMYDRTEAALKHILTPLNERKIPFAFVFGNHDDMSGITKDQQAEIYKSYEYCMPFNEDNPELECDTYNVPIYSSDSDKISYNLWMLDTTNHIVDGGEKQDCVTKKALAWYVEKSEELKAENGGEPVYSLMFQHIPPPEISELLLECRKDEANSVKFGGKYYILNPKMACGTLGEHPHPYKINNGQFEIAKKRGDVSAIVSGHDHKNCFVGRIDGVDIVQTPCASFRCYGNHKRGVRVFEINESDPKNYKTYPLSYFDICGNGLIAKLRNIWDADDKFKNKVAILTATAAVALVVIGTIIKFM